ncbi:MAG: hypothetical protein AAF327_23100 [Cyanobacteria bacterium P01_A01_bin.37]
MSVIKTSKNNTANSSKLIHKTDQSVWHRLAIVSAIAAIASPLWSSPLIPPAYAGQEHQAQAAEVDTQSFTIQAGALIEAVYLNAPGSSEQLSQRLLPAYQEAVTRTGGEYLANFEVLQNDSVDRSVTHVALIQWPDAVTRAAVKETQGYTNIEGQITDVGFFAAQQDTPVVLDGDKIYDFTSAWTIATEPAHMAIVMQVIGTYFQKIQPVIERYQISTVAFLGRYPGAPQDESRVYAPDITGIFEWQRLEDFDVFQNDPDWLEHVDIRNAVLSREADALLTRVMR